MSMLRTALVGGCALAALATAVAACSLATEGTSASPLEQGHPGAGGDAGFAGGAGEGGAAGEGGVGGGGAAGSSGGGGESGDASAGGAGGAGGGPVTQDASSDTPIDASFDAPLDVALDTPDDAPLDTAADAPTDAPPPTCTPGVNPCDLDCDGHRAPGGGCAGDDCCDEDDAAHPGQTSFFDHADACGSFDYDCDGQATPIWGTGKQCGWTLFGCTGDQGFESGPPACGQSGAWAACVTDYWGGCKDDSGSRTQACR